MCFVCRAKARKARFTGMILEQQQFVREREEARTNGAEGGLLPREQRIALHDG